MSFQQAAITVILSPDWREEGRERERGEGGRRETREGEGGGGR